jgi:undecaprenyl-diphosphatase
MPKVRAGLPEQVRKRLDPTQRFGLRLTLFAVAVVLVAVPFATLVFQVLGKGSLTRLDGRVANDLNNAVNDSPTIVRILQLISWLGRPVVLGLVVAVAVVVLWRRGQPKLIAFLVLTTLGGGLVDSLVKILVNRPRPVVDHPVSTAMGKSFPSGHSMSSLITYGALLVIFLPAVRSRRGRRITLAATTVLILAIGVSRLMLGVHFVTDVIGGFILGAAWLAGAVAIFEVWRVERGKRPTEPLTEGVEPEAGPALRNASGQ